MGLARAHPLTKTQAMEPSRQTRSSYGPPYPLGRWSSVTFARFSPAPVGLFSRSRLRGTQGVRLYTTTQVWVPGGLCGAYSGRSNPRNLASNHGVALRGARAEQDNGKPTCQLFCSTAVALYFVAATIQEQPHIKFVWTTTMRVWTLHIGVCCVQ